MKFFWTFLFISVAVYSLQAQLITVKDSNIRKPIPWVSLSSLNPNFATQTNLQGQVDISNFKTSDTIEIRHLGYETMVMSYEDIGKNNFEIFLKPETSQLNEIVVSATKFNQFSRNIPNKVSKISSKDVALLNPQTAADLLRISGEVFIQKSQQGGGSPMIRGFSANRLLYAVDGVRMNTAIFRSGNIQNVISLDPLAIENTEVLFGPGSIVYGSDAIGGVMSFQTLTPKLSSNDTLDISGKALSRYASANNEITNHAAVNFGWKKWATTTSMTYSNYGELRMGKNGPENYLKLFYVQREAETDRVIDNPHPRVQTPSGYAQFNVMQKIRFRPNENWDFQFGFHFSKTSEYARYDRLIETQSNGKPVFALWNYGPQIWNMNNVMVTHTSYNNIYDQMTVRLAHQYFEESRIDRRLNHHRLRTQSEQVNAYSANVDFEKILGKNHLYYGLEYVLNDVHSRGSAIDIRNNESISVPDRYPASLWNSYSAYINYQYVVSDKNLFQMGTRINGFNLTSDFRRHLEFFPFDFQTTSLNHSAITGSLAWIYTPDASWKITLNASSGFRSPNVDDVGKLFDFVNGEVIVPNTALNAEIAYNGELSLSKNIGKFLKLETTAFYTFLDNAMVRRPFPIYGQDSIVYNGVLSKVFALQNAAFGTVYGFNLGLELSLLKDFHIMSRYNYQRGKEEMGNGVISPSRHAAPAFGLTQLSYKNEKFTIQFYVEYNAEVSFENLNIEEQSNFFIYDKDSNGQPFSPFWYSINIKGLFKLNKYWTLSGGVENIADQRYRPYSSGLVAPGRNLIISLRADF